MKNETYAILAAVLAIALGCMLALMAGLAGADAAQPRERESFAEVGEPAFEPPQPEQPQPEQPEPEQPEPPEPSAALAPEWTEPEPAGEWSVPVEYDVSDESYDVVDIPEGGDLRTQGVVYDEGTRYTWYGQGTLPGGGLTELNNNGRTVDERGFVIDGDGYIAVASSDLPKGNHIDTPWGEAIVYDTGCATGTIDVYTDWG